MRTLYVSVKVCLEKLLTKSEIADKLRRHDAYGLYCDSAPIISVVDFFESDLALNIYDYHSIVIKEAQLQQLSAAF